MTLNMPHPVKDPKSGSYYIRVRVPADLKASFGRTEISKSLRAREPAVAKERFAAEYAAIQRHWTALRATPEPRPFKQIVTLAGRVYHRLMATHEVGPGESPIWEHVIRPNEEATRDESTLEQRYGPKVRLHPRRAFGVTAGALANAGGLLIRWNVLGCHEATFSHVRNATPRSGAARRSFTDI